MSKCNHPECLRTRWALNQVLRTLRRSREAATTTDYGNHNAYLVGWYRQSIASALGTAANFRRALKGRAA